MKKLVVGLLILMAAPVLAAVKVPPYERVQLPNGATLLLMERRELPLIHFNAVIKGGGLVDPTDREGTARLLAGLLEKGAGKRDAYTFAADVAAVGGVIATDATVETVSIAGSFLSRDRDLMVSLLTDMLLRPKLDATEFATLRDRQIEFIRAAKESELSSLVGLYGRAALLADHRYGRPVTGSESSLAGISVDDVRRYYEQHVGADRLILSIVGDFDARTMKRTMTQAIGEWRKASAPMPAIAAPQPAKGRRVVLIDAPDSVQSYFWIGNVGVSRGDPRRASIDIANTLFGGRFTSMLNSELRIRTGLSYGARSNFQRFAEAGPWAITSFTQAKTTIEALDLALEVLQRLHDQPIAPDMLTSGRQYVLGQYPLALETSAQWAGTLNELELYGLPRSYIENYASELVKVDAPRLQQVIDEAFPSVQDVTIVVIGPAEQIRAGLSKYGPLTEAKLVAPTFAISAKPGLGR